MAAVGKDDREKLKQAESWLNEPGSSVEQKMAARDHLLYLVQHSDVPDLRKRAGSIVSGLGLLK